MDLDESEKVVVEKSLLQEENINTSAEDDLMKELEKTIEMEAETRERSHLTANNDNQVDICENSDEKTEAILESQHEEPPKIPEKPEITKNEDELQVSDIIISDTPKVEVKEKENDSLEVERKEEKSEIEKEQGESSKVQSTPLKSDTPDDIINLLKSLSPEKLKEIKTKVLEISESTISTCETSEAQKMDVDEDKQQKVSQSEQQQVTSTTPIADNDDDVICLDSDDDDENLPAATSDEASSEKTKSINGAASDDNSSQNGEKSTTESKVNGNSVAKQLKECINPDCPREAEDEFLECPTYAMSMFYVTRKPNKLQWVCSTCHAKVLKTYEELCTYVTNNEPWCKVEIPRKQDLVEIIDSDEEEARDDDGDSAACKRQKASESEMIDFDDEARTELEEIIINLASKVDFNLQLEAERKNLEKRMNKSDKDTAEIEEMCKKLERQSYRMYDELYSLNRPKIQQRPSLDLELMLVPDSGGTSGSAHTAQKIIPDISITPVHIPPHRSATKSTSSQQTTPIITPSEDSMKICYAIRQRGVPMPHWMACKIVEDLSTAEEKKFKVQFSDNMANSLQVISGKEISYPTPSDKLEIGARVIALFPRAPRKGQPAGSISQRRYLPGVIGEKLTQYNKRRYLVFCDYGQVKYCNMNEVREIQESSEFVWNDVHQNLRQFIRDYLESKTNRSRALLNVRLNTTVMTERGGNWRKTIVQEVDCSLVRVYFPHEQVSEWLYRGSKRLYTMFQQAQRAQGNTIQRRNDPSITFIEIDDDASNDQSGGGGEVKRNIAKKSTGRQQNQQLQQSSTSSNENQKTIILNDSKIYLEDPMNVYDLKHFTPRKEICPDQFKPHECTEKCIKPLKNNLSSFEPLAKPLLTCWERQIIKHNKSRFVIYKAPCGRRLRNYLEVFKYFQLTQCFLNIDNFDFDENLSVLSRLVVNQTLCPLFIPDISNGKEGMKIQCINAFDEQRPPPLEYSPHRNPMPGVNINTDPEFMSCCDCTDECYDKSKCACFQLTIQGAKYKNLMEEDPEDISYVWKRLLTAVPTGIYECNSRCKCSKRCLNKVVQHPVQIKMQLYRTKSRGWGLQSMHDIPKGTFVCIYAGNLYSEKDANALCQGQDHGDEYFAELDLIENAEGRKDGFESGVVNPDESDQEKDTDSDYNDNEDSHDYEDGDFVGKSNRNSFGNREIVTRSSRTSLRRDKSAKSSASSTPQRTNSEDSSDDEMVNMMPNTENAMADGMRIPFRKLYGPKEKVYIMDAKKCGNVGRYFNHSCDPNLFVQSVFVDTHDLRFPWIAFFAMRAIKGGEELTWNYNYEVGSVPSKVLYCKCGAKNCRGRIL